MDDFHTAESLLDAGDGAKAMPILHRLAEKGQLSAMHSIAHTHLYGLAGVERNYDIAFKWFGRAANNGCPQAMYHMGMCNRDGLGTARNPEAALQWYRKSADYGDEDAEYEVGACYEKGIGTPVDLAQALNWYRRAAADGQPDAAARLRELGRTG